MNSLYKIVLVTSLIFCFIFPLSSDAQELVFDKVITVKAEVVEVIKQEIKIIPGTEVKRNNQTLKVRIIEGNEKGKEIILDNDYVDLNKGEIFLLRHTTDSLAGTDYYSVDEPYRLPNIFFLVAIFLLAVFLFGGIQGVRGIVSLVGSLLLIVYVLLPGILHGYSPLFVTIGVSSLIIIVGSFITHGFNKTTVSAVFGMVITVLITGLSLDVEDIH
jgi:uncharacterized membrane protein